MGERRWAEWSGGAVWGEQGALPRPRETVSNGLSGKTSRGEVAATCSF